MVDSNSMTSVASSSAIKRTEDKIRGNIDNDLVPKNLRNLTIEIYSMIALILFIEAYTLWWTLNFNNTFTHAYSLQRNFSDFEVAKSKLFNMDLIALLATKYILNLVA